MRGRLLAALIGAWFISQLSACTLEDRNLTLAVSTEEPAPTIAESVRSMLDARGYSIDVETATNPTEALAAIRNRQLDFAIVDEPDRSLPGLVTLAPLYPSILHVLHNRVETPGSFEELIGGANVYAGPVGGAAYRLLMQLSIDFDLTDGYFQLLDNPWTVSPDVYFVFGGLLPRNSIAQLDGYQLYSFADSDDVSGGTVVYGMYDQILRFHFDGDRTGRQRNGVAQQHDAPVILQFGPVANHLRLDRKSRMQDKNGKMETTFQDAAHQPGEIPKQSPAADRRAS